MNEKRLILVIEDEHAISNFICRALAANDYKAIPASSGKEGLSLFFSHSPDLVLLEEEWTSLQAQQIHLKQPHMARIAALKDQYMDHMDLDMEEV